MAVKHLVENVRDIALVGHRAAGKTSLADALLFDAHAVDRLGSVDDGTSVADSDDEEHKHHFSIDTHVLHADHDGKHLNILDAPGSPDFIGAALEALAAVETAVIVVSAVNGVEMNTRRMFKEATEPRACRAPSSSTSSTPTTSTCRGWSRASRRRSARTACCSTCRTASAPGMREVHCLLDPRQIIPPSAARSTSTAARSQLIEAVVESDEALLEKYLSEGKVTLAELEADITRAMDAGTLIPIFCTSAKKDKGVRELLDALARYGLSPAFARKRLEGLQVGANGSTHQLEPTEQEEFVAQVFKVVNDKFVGHLSFIRVLAGQAPAQPQRRQPAQRADAPRRAPARSAGQGARRRFTKPGRATSSPSRRSKGWRSATPSRTRATRRSCRTPHFPTPMFGLAIEPKTRGDEQKISVGLHKIAERRPDREGDPRHADARTRHQRREPAAPRHHPRAAEGPVRRGGEHEGAEDPVPRDDQRRRRPATTSTRSRPAAAGSSPRFTSASTRCRARSRRRSSARRSSRTRVEVREAAELPLRPGVQLRVHRPHRRRDDPEQLHPGRREGVQGDAGARRARRLPHPGLRRGGSLRQVPRRGLVRSGVQDGGPARVPQGVPRGPAVAARTDREARNHGAEQVHRARSSATCRRSGRTSRTRTACRAT